jgi:hypothetical protein
MQLAHMRLVPVDNPRLGQTLCCIGCHRMVQAAVMMADLDGPAFAAYWCPRCLMPSEERKNAAYARAREERA